VKYQTETTSESDAEFHTNDDEEQINHNYKIENDPDDKDY